MLTVGACALPRPVDEPDPLLELAEAADRDARELVSADASHGEDAGRLRRIGDVRRAHAEHLAAEIRRLAPEGETTIGIGTGTPPVCPPLEEVRTRLRADARRAGEVAVSAEGYRAELAAAVSAACTAAVEVVLA